MDIFGSQVHAQSTELHQPEHIMDILKTFCNREFKWSLAAPALFNSKLWSLFIPDYCLDLTSLFGAPR